MADSVLLQEKICFVNYIFLLLTLPVCSSASWDLSQLTTNYTWETKEKQTKLLTLRKYCSVPPPTITSNPHWLKKIINWMVSHTLVVCFQFIFAHYFHTGFPYHGDAMEEGHSRDKLWECRKRKWSHKTVRFHAHKIKTILTYSDKPAEPVFIWRLNHIR